MVGKFKLLFSQPFPYFGNISSNTWNTIGVNMYLNLKDNMDNHLIGLK